MLGAGACGLGRSWPGESSQRPGDGERPGAGAPAARRPSTRRGPTRHAEEVTQLPATHPYVGDLDAEARGWYRLADLVRSLTPDECVVPGYYVDPAWSVRDVMGHVGTWLAEAGVQFERIAAGTYAGHDIDIDALNATFLEAMREQPWEVSWTQ